MTAIHMGPPQIIFATWLGFLLLYAAAQHGKPRTGEHSFPVAFSLTLIYVLLLAWGGFWSTPQ